MVTKHFTLSRVADFLSLPVSGEENIIYLLEDLGQIWRWDPINNEYKSLSLPANRIQAPDGTASVNLGTEELEIYSAGYVDISANTVIFLNASVGIIINNLNVYNTDLEADNDINLPSNALYKLTGNRGIFQKP